MACFHATLVLTVLYHAVFLALSALAFGVSIGWPPHRKSALLLRFADDTYTESYISTIGVDFVRFRWLSAGFSRRRRRSLVCLVTDIRVFEREGAACDCIVSLTTPAHFAVEDCSVLL